MSPAAGVEMYERFIMAEAVTEGERVRIILQMVAEGKISYLGAVESRERFVEEVSKFARVWVVTRQGGKKQDDDR